MPSIPPYEDCLSRSGSSTKDKFFLKDRSQRHLSFISGYIEQFEKNESSADLRCSGSAHSLTRAKYI
jgi:hypothetical protein